MRCSSIKGLINSKKGKLYLKFVLVAAILAAAIYSYSAFAAVPSAVPVIVNTNATTVSSVQIANACFEGDGL